MKTIEQRFGDARSTLDEIRAALVRNRSKLPTDVEASFFKVLSYRSDIDHWDDLLGARTVARLMLEGLEERTDKTSDTVLLGPSRVKYQHARFIGVAAYMTTSWALADRVTGMAGHVLCTQEAGRNVQKPVQLVSHFVRREACTKSTAAGIVESIRLSFGWPIGLSYAIRNHFAHEGAYAAGSDFFDGVTAASGFRISANGWKVIVETATSYSITEANHRAGAAWPEAPSADLRVLLGACEREMDDALGILVGSACGTLRSHAGFMLGVD
jgi:hypothetical protein